MRRIAIFAITCAALAACDTPGGESDAGPEPADAPPPVCELEIEAEEPPAEPARHTPRWAFEPWISKDISDRDDTFAFVAGFRERGIPVGAIVLDSPWDSQYTTFRPSDSRYPEFAQMVDALHADGVRVVLWTTAFVNQRSFDLEPGGDVYRGPAPNLAEGLACGLFVNDGELYDWWKGAGASVDFFDGRARAWWHRQQDFLLDLGIDGWKLDFGDSYLEEDATLRTEAGDVPHQEYAEAYYRDFLAYGVARRGPEFTTMVRAWDASYDRRARFHARPEHAPVVWMGDNRRDWIGLVDVLDHTFRSAQAGYVVLGSDVGGYLDRDDLMLTTVIPFDVENFQRWTALSGMMPFMQLHGRGNLAPWTVPGTPAEQDETVAVWRYWATLHHAMVPYWYSIAEEAYATDGVIVHPVGADEAAWQDDWRYVVGEAFLVAPLIESGDARDVALPAGARWYDWWDRGGDALDGGITLPAYDVGERVRIPVFVREGAIVPMHVEDDVNGLGTDASEGLLTVLVWPATEASSFRLREEPDDAITTIGAQRDATSTTITFAPARASVIVRVRAESAPSEVLADGTALATRADRAALDAAESGAFYDASERALWVKSTAAVATIEAR
jgi:alpha-glucosidase (family GH31 glycosyl hydrolase)